MINDGDKNRVREASDLVALVSETVALKQRGREFWGRCPFHDEKTPSFKVDPSSQLFYCFGCQASGDVFSFVMRSQNMEFLDALRYLAERANITLSETKGELPQGRRARLLEAMELSAAYYAQQLLRTASAPADAARTYLSNRKMGLDLAKRWQLGFAPGGTNLLSHLRTLGFNVEECKEANLVIEGRQGRLRDRFYNRVIFPVADLQGRIVAFGGRIISEGEPKYLNTSETPLFHKSETLYALDRAKAAITSTGVVIVVEGYTDTIAMHEAGFVNTVATLGTALSSQHLKLLNRFAKKVIYLFDGDEAGKRAAVRAAGLINKDITPEAGKFRFTLEVAKLPLGLDPADMLERKGAQALQKVLDAARPLITFALEQSLIGANLSSPEGRNAALRSALTVLLPIRGSILAKEYIAQQLSPQLAVDYSAALALFNSMQTPRIAERSSQTTSKCKEPLSEARSKLQKDLIVLYIEYPETRTLLVKAFERIAWDSEDLAALAQGLSKASEEAESEELYTLALELSPAYAPVLAQGLQQDFAGNVVDYARLLMYMLRELQLQNEIALVRIAYAQAETDEQRNTLFEDIAQKQTELATIRERLARIPKTMS